MAKLLGGKLSGDDGRYRSRSARSPTIARLFPRFSISSSEQQHGVRCCSQVGSGLLSSRLLKQFL